MKTKSLSVVLLTVMTWVSSASAAKPLLRVNGKEMSDVSITLAMRYAIRTLPPGTKDDDALLLMTVEQSILRTLLAQEARKAGITASQQEVAARVAEKKRQLANPEIIDRVLRELQGSEADVFALEEEMVLADKFVSTKIAPSVKVSEADARVYYDSNPKEFEHPEQWKLRMIMAALRKDATADEIAAAQKKAQDALARCTKGEDFSAVAAALSDDPSKGKGGEIGWVRKGMLFAELEPAVFALETGQVSSVLKSPRGFHVFRVDVRRGPGVYPWDEVHDQLLSTLRTRKLQERLGEVIGPLRTAAKIEILDPTIEAVMKKETGEKSTGTRP